MSMELKDQDCMYEIYEDLPAWENYTHTLNTLNAMIQEQEMLLASNDITKGSHNDLECLKRTRELLKKRYKRFENATRPKEY